MTDLDPVAILAEWPEALDDPAVPVIRSLATALIRRDAQIAAVRAEAREWMQGARVGRLKHPAQSAAYWHALAIQEALDGPRHA
jgi:hypothetical protein